MDDHDAVEEEPTTVETFSSYEEENDDDNSSVPLDQDEKDNDDDEDDDGEGGDTALPFWRQHSVAIVVAVAAASVGHFYNRYHVGNLSLPLSMFPAYLPPLPNSEDRHDHLEDFVRTSNISFCHQPAPHNNDDDNNDSRLHVMEFYLSRDLFETMEAIYLEDETREDTAPTPSVIPSSEYQCLLQQYMNRPKDVKLKGWTYVFKNPTMEDLYPELAPTSIEGGGGGGRGRSNNALKPSSTKNGVALTKERMRKLQQPPLVFTGFAAKFVNLSPKPVQLYWDGNGGHEEARRLVGEIDPFESLGTATMPGQSFHVTPVYDPSTALQRWVVTADTALVFYEPLTDVEMEETGLRYDPVAYKKYQRQLLNRAFARDYTVISGRTWLGNFPRRFPAFHMHPASYIGQEHSVGDGLSLEVASVTPRVFVIKNFLSKEQCQEIIQQGQKQGLVLSTLHSSSANNAERTRDTSTRSSSNSWLTRDHSDLTETVYQRAAMVTHIDPDLMQKFHETRPEHHSIAESLQVVRYKKGEEYTPHHDFVYPPVNDRFQGTRFATLLIYLNTVKDGGETRFPRAVNNHNAKGLEITPRAGTAVLFYNMLSDGNYDDLSQHGSNPVLDGEKWLANLWVRTMRFGSCLFFVSLLLLTL